MLSKALLVVASLNEVDRLLGAIGPGVEAPLGIEIHAEVVPATFREELEVKASRVIAPDVLSEELVAALVVSLVHLDAGCDGAAGAAIKPSVRAELEAVGDRVGVLESEP